MWLNVPDTEMWNALFAFWECSLLKRNLRYSELPVILTCPLLPRLRVWKKPTINIVSGLGHQSWQPSSPDSWLFHYLFIYFSPVLPFEMLSKTLIHLRDQWGGSSGNASATQPDLSLSPGMLVKMKEGTSSIKLSSDLHSCALDTCIHKHTP